nr:hypothetical protein [Escherichia coli]
MVLLLYRVTPDLIPRLPHDFPVTVRHLQGKITKARTPQGLTPDSFCPWLLFASYVLTLP